jgi:hypothetical protein
MLIPINCPPATPTKTNFPSNFYLPSHPSSTSKHIHSKWSFTSLPLISYSKRMYLAPAKSWSDYLSAVFLCVAVSKCREKMCTRWRKRNNTFNVIQKVFFCHFLPSLFAHSSTVFDENNLPFVTILRSPLWILAQRDFFCRLPPHFIIFIHIFASSC